MQELQKFKMNKYVDSYEEMDTEENQEFASPHDAPVVPCFKNAACETILR